MNLVNVNYIPKIKLGKFANIISMVHKYEKLCFVTQTLVKISLLYKKSLNRLVSIFISVSYISRRPSCSSVNVEHLMGQSMSVYLSVAFLAKKNNYLGSN